jgi:hypothetical protein
MRILIVCLLLPCLALVSCDAGRSTNTGQNPAANALTITSGNLQPAQVGVFYAETIDATGGSQTGYTWSIGGSGLPSGLSIGPSSTPSTSLSGVPTVSGMYQFQIEVVDSNGNRASKLFDLAVTPPSTPPPPQPVPGSFYGVPASGNLVFLIEVTSTMTGIPIADLRAELVNCISGLTQYDTFDVIAYNDSMAGGYARMWGTQLPATTANKSSAISWVNSGVTNPTGGADQLPYVALRDSFQYPYVDMHFYYTHTRPTNVSQILADYPGWASTTQQGFTQVVVAKTTDAQSWGQWIVALSGGILVP